MEKIQMTTPLVEMDGGSVIFCSKEGLLRTC